jgi:hypothetical protein
LIEEVEDENEEGFSNFPRDIINLGDLKEGYT